MAVGMVARLFGAEAGMGDGTGARLVEAGMAAGLAAGTALHQVELSAVECLIEARVAIGTVKRLSEYAFLTEQPYPILDESFKARKQGFRDHLLAFE